MENILDSYLWESHKLSCNFGLTDEQADRINSLIKLAHNNALEEAVIGFKIRIRNCREDITQQDYDNDNYKKGYYDALDDLLKML